MRRTKKRGEEKNSEEKGRKGKRENEKAEWKEGIKLLTHESHN